MRKLITSEERLTLGTKSFRFYLTEINSYNPLSPEEEYDLCVRMGNGDEEARETIIKHNLRFVVSVAKKYYGTVGTLEDLVNEGNYGLMVATQHYDPTRGFKFISYAVWWIRRSILFYLNNKDNIVRVPNHKLSVINKIKEEYMALEQTLSKPPNPSDLILHCGDTYSKEDVDMFYSHYLGNTKQLDKEVGDEGESVRAINLMENNLFPEADYLVVKEDEPHRIRIMLKHLNDKQGLVMTKIFGLDGQEPENLEAIGVELGITKERVRQIKEKSLSILRKKLKLNYTYI